MEKNTPKFDLIPRPSGISSTECPEVKERLVAGKAVLNVKFLDATLAFYTKGDEKHEKLLQNCAQSLFRLSSASSGEIGPLSAVNRPDEPTLSGFYASWLQHILSSHLMSSKASSAHDADNFSPHILACGQQLLGAGNNDITLYRRTALGMHPRVIWELGLQNRPKEGQLFAYINNVDKVIGDDIQLILLGVVLHMHRGTAPTYELRAYQKVSCAGAPKIASFPISSGIYTIDNLARILRVVKYWMMLPNNAFRMTTMPRDNDLLKNVICIAREGVEYVYKCFDARNSRTARSRSTKYNLLYIPGCSTVVCEDSFAVIRYPKIAGDHIPVTSAACISIIEQLNTMHDNNILHLDIRASNCVFCSDLRSTLIDFDFAGEVGEARYPDNFNVEIGDGERHPDAEPGAFAERIHDCYALAAVFALVEPVDAARRAEWSGLVELLRRGELSTAAKNMRASGAMQLTSTCIISFSGLDATGSPAAAKKRPLYHTDEEEAEFDD